MNPPKASEHDHIQFLIAAQRVYSCMEAERVNPEGVAHDAYTRLLSRIPPDTLALWEEARDLVSLTEGILCPGQTLRPSDSPGDPTLEQAVVQGVYLQSGERTTLRQGEKRPCPCDAGLGFVLKLVMFDSWYANLKQLRDQGWPWLCRLVNPDGSGNRAVAELEIPQTGLVAHLKRFSLVKVFRMVSPHVDAQHRATSVLDLSLEALGGIANSGVSRPTIGSSSRVWGLRKHRFVPPKQRHQRLPAFGVAPPMNWYFLGVKQGSRSCVGPFVTTLLTLLLGFQLRNS